MNTNAPTQTQSPVRITRAIAEEAATNARAELRWLFATKQGVEGRDAASAAAVATIEQWLAAVPAPDRGAIGLRYSNKSWTAALTNALGGFTALAVRLHCVEHPATGSTPTLEKANRLPFELASLSSTYETLSGAHPALANYPTLGPLLATLSSGSKASGPERTALVCALIDLTRTKPHRLWWAILLQAFRRVLKKIRRKLIGDNAQTLDELLLTSFIEAIAGMQTDRDPGRMFMYVRQATRRRAIRAIRQEVAWQPFAFGVEADLEADPRTLEEPNLRGVWLRGKGMPGGARVELLDTVGDHGALWRLVRKTHPGRSRRELARIYARLQKRRGRLVQRLRARLAREAA